MLATILELFKVEA